MNREEAKQLSPVIQAFADGKTVQFRERNAPEWIDATSPIFGHDGTAWRIKPEPREFWVAKYRNGTDQVWSDKEQAKHYADLGQFPVETIHVREVIE